MLFALAAAAAALASAALAGMIGITISNLLFFPKLHHRGPPNGPALGSRPLVSVLIPARNEAAVIDGTVRRLLAQSYGNFELIVLDDNSEDGTGDLARAAAGGDPRLCVIGGKRLPSGWAGKNWACYQLSEAARGEVLLFTDADTIWAPQGLEALVREMVHNGADLQTVWPTQITETWAERLTVPNMALVVMGYLPILLTHFTRWSAFAAANGQVMAFRRGAYDRIDGHAGVRGDVVEDVKLARRIKAATLRLRMADGNQLISCRMYTGWLSVRNGFAKSIVGGYGSVFGVLLAILFHVTVFLLPPLWLLLGWPDTSSFPVSIGALSLTMPGWPAWPAVLTVAGMSVRAVTAWFTHQRSRDALLMPATVVVMTAISLLACWWQMRYGGPVWKGRLVRAGADLRGDSA
jgi:chlorobactene glucosyltransferase